MFSYHDPSIAGLEAQMEKLHAEVDANIARWEKVISKIKTRDTEEKKILQATDKLSAEYSIAPIAPKIMAAAQKLPQTELELKVTKYNAVQMAEDYKRLQSRYIDAGKTQIRLKNEKKALNKAIESLTADIEAAAARKDNDLQNENDNLRKDIARLNSKLKHQIEECQVKDTSIASKENDIVDLRELILAEQKADSLTSLHGHDSCHEVEVSLQEQSDMYSSRCEDLEGKLRVVTAERDDLRNKLKFATAIEAKKEQIDDSFSLQCSGTSDCTSCIPRLDQALLSSRAAEACALHSVDQAIHDRMNACEQLHKLQKQVSR